MTDLEITKLCAEAMDVLVEEEYWAGIGAKVLVTSEWDENYQCRCRYDPLHNDDQAMALVKKFTLQVWMPVNGVWEAIWPHHAKARSESINRAIVECVAKMQAAKP